MSVQERCTNGVSFRLMCVFLVRVCAHARVCFKSPMVRIISIVQFGYWSYIVSPFLSLHAELLLLLWLKVHIIQTGSGYARVKSGIQLSAIIHLIIWVILMRANPMGVCTKTGEISVHGNTSRILHSPAIFVHSYAYERLLNFKPIKM